MGGAEGSQRSKLLYTIVVFRVLHVESPRSTSRWEVLTCIGQEVCTYMIGARGSTVSLRGKNECSAFRNELHYSFHISHEVPLEPQVT